MKKAGTPQGVLAFFLAIIGKMRYTMRIMKIL